MLLSSLLHQIKLLFNSIFSAIFRSSHKVFVFFRNLTSYILYTLKSTHPVKCLIDIVKKYIFHTKVLHFFRILNQMTQVSSHPHTKVFALLSYLESDDSSLLTSPEFCCFTSSLIWQVSSPSLIYLSLICLSIIEIYEF